MQTPAGGVEKGEAPLEAAKKELEEETGMRGKKWVSLGIVNPLTMVIKSPQNLFLALDLEEGTKTEKEIEVIKIPLDEAYLMVLNGEITYAPSCVAILKAKVYLEKMNLLNSYS